MSTQPFLAEPLRQSQADRPSPPQPSSPHRRWQVYVAASIIVAAGIAAYWNSFAGVLVFDDTVAISDNPSIRNLRDVWAVLTPRTELPTAGRPVINLTLAVNYAIGGAEDLRGYHAFNLAVHLLAALTLMGVLRRTLLSAPMRDRFGRHGTWLALAAAALWMLHPLQVQSVTYITLRTESVVSLMCVLTLYLVIRSSLSSRPWAWYVAAVAACATGMASKEVMATAPLAVLAYDRLFLSGGFGAALKRRWPLYVALGGTWLVLAALLATGPRTETTGFGPEQVSPLQYAATQAGVVMHYLRLVIWPSGLVADYAWPWATSPRQVLAPAAAVLAMLVATVYLLLRGRPAAMGGVSWFLLLAPSSSFAPILHAAFEYRIYLASAGPIALIVLGAYWFVDRMLGREAHPGSRRAVITACACIAAALAVALGYLTHERNRLYYSGTAFWQDVVDKQPNSFRGQTNLGSELVQVGRMDEAIEHYRAAMMLDPNDMAAPYNLGCALMTQGKFAEASRILPRLVELRPQWPESYMAMGFCMASLDHHQEAEDNYRKVLALDPSRADAHRLLGDALVNQVKYEQAAASYERSIALDPGHPDAYLHLAAVCEAAGRLGRAVKLYEQAMSLRPGNPDIQAALQRARDKLATRPAR